MDIGRVFVTAILFVFLCLFTLHAQIADENQFWNDYCSPARTTALKGIFVVVVFISHFRGYVTMGEQDALAIDVVSFLGQLMVTPFLFYSGFGVAESIQKKGIGYVRKIPVHRALKTLLHFDVAVLMFCVLNLVLGKEIVMTDLLQALVCWGSIGNSNWYIFTMVCLYLITAAAFFVFGKSKYAALSVTTVLSAVYIVLLAQFKQDWWYNTVFCYILGMWYSALRPYIEKVVCRNDLLYCTALLIVFYVFCQSSRIHWISSWVYQIHGMVFMILVVGISMKLRLDNSLLQFLGRHTFGIYILQRIPMIYFTETGLFENKSIILFVLCFLSTCILTLVFEKLVGCVDRVLFSRTRDAVSACKQ